MMLKKSYKKSLFIFRRDLRLHDNTALIHALKESEVVMPFFNIDPIQVGPRNRYRSKPALEYMFQSLEDLSNQLRRNHARLYIFNNTLIKTLQSLIKHQTIDALFINFDYTPFSTSRDVIIEKFCLKNKIAFHGYHDLLLIGDPNELKTSQKKPYARYGAFYKAAWSKKIEKPQPLPKKATFYTGKLSGEKNLDACVKKIKLSTFNQTIYGGRNNALKIITKIKKYTDYNQERDFPGLDATTHLSAAHKFGTLSIRETYHAIKENLSRNNQLIKELYWRDFFTYSAYHNPHVFGKPFYEKYEKLSWSLHKNHFKAWCTGTTGFPIVDAGMRQLNSTGWMHNRSRMITASFLIKDLHINWLSGERYFATQLIDYDPAVNNGNWQWVASTGSESQPYFRIFNPWLQQKKYDKDCSYIKKWIPELSDVPNNKIHAWYKYYHEYNSKGYPKPMLDHTHEQKISIQYYRKCFR